MIDRDLVNWHGKTMNIIGDSITYGLVNRPNIGDTVSRRFSTIVSEALGMTCNNYGISSSTISVNPSNPTGRNPMVERYVSMEDGADLVIVAGGTNDWQYNWSPLGDMNSRDNTTFYGALHNLCSGLQAKYPDAKILFMTPLRRSQSPYQLENAVNANGKTLKEYGDIIKEVCASYSIPVLDMYPLLQINPYITSVMEEYVPDGTHPNDAGHVVIAKRLMTYLRKFK